MLMCDASYDSHQKYYIGLVHVFSTLSMLVLNLILLVRSMGLETLPEAYQKMLEIYNERTETNELAKWLEDKR